ncbi:hypothetical protein GE21DRAFT_1068070 [Neurospora crassa]|nr:hypothetical protein GE21DRAFT_1068070 [Neurospora crassa]
MVQPGKPPFTELILCCQQVPYECQRRKQLTHRLVDVSLLCITHNTGLPGLHARSKQASKQVIVPKVTTVTGCQLITVRIMMDMDTDGHDGNGRDWKRVWLAATWTDRHTLTGGNTDHGPRIVPPVPSLPLSYSELCEAPSSFGCFLCRRRRRRRQGSHTCLGFFIHSVMKTLKDSIHRRSNRARVSWK